MKTIAKCLMVVIISVPAAFGAETNKTPKDGSRKRKRSHMVEIENQPQDEAAASHEETNPIGDVVVLCILVQVPERHDRNRGTL